MALVRIPDQNRVITDETEVKEYLAQIGIGYARWNGRRSVGSDSTAEEILEAYAQEIEEQKAAGGYVTADVIDVKPDTPNLDVMLAKFAREHWHDEDEVRFIIEGHGVFHVHPKPNMQTIPYPPVNGGGPERSPQNGGGLPVVAIEVSAGDLLRVPAGTWHWFDLCSDRRIRAIRLFQDPSGWTPHYTESGIDKGYLPVCFGLTFLPGELQEI